MLAAELLWMCGSVCIVMHYTNDLIERSRLQMIIFRLKGFEWFAIPVVLILLICLAHHSSLSNIQYLLLIDSMVIIQVSTLYGFRLHTHVCFVFWFWVAIII